MLPKGTLVRVKDKYDDSRIVQNNGKLWLVEGPISTGSTIYYLKSLATGFQMRTHQDNFDVAGEEQEEETHHAT